MLMHNNLSYRELSYDEDLAILDSVYDGILMPSMPDPDELESVENMRTYLQRKAEGWYGSNNYHIVVAYLDGQPIGISVSDYLSEPNVGVIEYVAVHQDYRRNGYGRRIMEYTEDLLNRDSQRGVDYILGEVPDPFKSPHEDPDTLEARLRFLHELGYMRIKIPYIQPSLGEGQQSVEYFLLVAKEIRNNKKDHMISVKRLRQFLQNYMRWAMRINDPEQNRDYMRMNDFFKRRRAPSTTEVALLDLSKYLGDRQKLETHEINHVAVRDFGPAYDIYKKSFPPFLLATEEEFNDMLRRNEKRFFAYHLASIVYIFPTSIRQVEGMASFFTFCTAGFGGYYVIRSDANGKLRQLEGLSSYLIARAEMRMRKDNPMVRGWFIEAENPDALPENLNEEERINRQREARARLRLFGYLGFWKININYRQPPLPGNDNYDWDHAPSLILLYKEFGDDYYHYIRPRLTKSEFIRALSEIFYFVYEIRVPSQHDFYHRIVRQLGTSDEVPF